MDKKQLKSTIIMVVTALAVMTALFILASGLSANTYSTQAVSSPNSQGYYDDIGNSYSAPAEYGQGYSSNQGGAAGGNCCGSTGGSAPAGSSGSTGSGGGSCCSNGKSISKDEARKQALDYYVEKYKDKDVVAEVEDFGCHLQVNIKKNGKLVKAISLRGGKISELN